MLRLILTDDERATLDDAARHARDARLWRRLRALQLLADGSSCGEVARMLGTNRQRVHAWATLYRRARHPGALEDRAHPGRPPRLSAEQRERLRQLLADAPTAFGYAAKRWTVPLLQTHLRREAGVDVSTSTIRRVLRSMAELPPPPRDAAPPGPTSAPMGGPRNPRG